MKKQKGITLIALIITIIVLLILAGISITAVVGDNGLISKAKEAQFKNIIKEYQEQADLYVISQETIFSGAQGANVNTRDKAKNPNAKFEEEFKIENINTEFNTVFKEVKKDYINKICVYNNEFYYVPINEEKSIQQEVQWCFEVNVKVWGYNNYDDYITDINTPKGEYVEKNGIYVCEPDLTQFNKNTTYYVTYDENGNEEISKSIREEEEPEDWYDYANSKWANVVTISGDQKAYWVWIPRYVYMLDEEAVNNRQPKIKFVNTNNDYIDYQTKQITNYPDTAPQYDENNYQTNYCLPEAFTWDKEGATKRELPGYWVSKYEISSTRIDAEFLFSMDETSITIEDADTSKVHITPSIYEIYIDGNLYGTTNSLPYTITGLKSNREYKISAIAKTNAGQTIGKISEEVVKTLEKEMKEVTKPDFTGFNQENTYYVNYDENMLQDESKKITEEAPENWYDYKQNKWANIVVKNQDVVNNEIFGDSRSYFVWIPRYEYKVKERFRQVQIRFISKDQTEPTEGYQIPEAFTWDGQNLAGYWVSKYEISNANNTVGQFLFVPGEREITIQDVEIYDSSVSSASRYDIYVNETLQASNVTIPYTINNLTPNTNYRIKAVAKDSQGKYLGMIEEEEVRPLESIGLKEITKPDLTGFNPNNTYYVTYDDSGAETRTPITSAAPENWYDYSNQKWANIVTVSGGKEAYFVWIPRYEYKVKDNFEQIEIRFITTNSNARTDGYLLPEAFQWDGKDLTGYWVSKYEISQ